MESLSLSNMVGVMKATLVKLNQYPLITISAQRRSLDSSRVITVGSTLFSKLHRQKSKCLVRNSSVSIRIALNFGVITIHLKPSN